MKRLNKFLVVFGIIAILGVLFGARTYLQNWQIVQDSALNTLGVDARTTNETIISKIDDSLGIPLRLHDAPSATKDSKLYIDSNFVQLGSGEGLSSPIANDYITVWSAATIDFQTGAVTGGTILLNGGTFALPTCTVGEYMKMSFTFRTDINSVDSTYDQNAVFGNLPNAGVQLARLEGYPIGMLWLVCTNAAGQYKTPWSATNIIESKPSGAPITIINNVEKGAGGAGGDTSFKIQAITSNVVTIKKGFRYNASTKKTLTTYDGADLDVDLSFNLKTATNTNGVTSPSASTTYYLYIDLNEVGTETTYGDASFPVYPVESGTSGAFIVLAEKPETIDNPNRYMFLGTLKTDGSSNYVYKQDLARSIDPMTPVSASPVVYSLDSQTIGSVGSSGQLKMGHILAENSFRAALRDNTKLSFYNLSADSNDDYGSYDLNNNGSIVWTSNNIFGQSNSAATLDGSNDYFSSTNSFFNPNSVSWACGGWFYAADWTSGSSYGLFGNWYNSSDMGYLVYAGADGIIDFTATNTNNVQDVNIYYDGANLADNSWHHFAVVYDYSAGVFKAFIDGSLIGQASLANTRTITTSSFKIGAYTSAPLYFFAGRVEDFFFAKDLFLTDHDIRKIVSTKITHSKNLATNRQDWQFIHYPLGVDPVTSLSDTVVDMSDLNILYADFSSLGATDKIDIKLVDTGMNNINSVPIQSPEFYFTSTPSLTGTNYPTYLQQAPRSFSVSQLISSEWQPKDPVSYIATTSTSPYYLRGDLSTLSCSVSNPCRVVVSATNMAVGVGTATEANAGIIPNINYNKYKLVSTTYQALIDDMIATDSSAAIFTITLPATPAFGNTASFFDATCSWDDYEVTVGRNGEKINSLSEDLVLDEECGSVKLIYINSTVGWRTYQ